MKPYIIFYRYFVANKPQKIEAIYALSMHSFIIKHLKEPSRLTARNIRLKSIPCHRTLRNQADSPIIASRVSQ